MIIQANISALFAQRQANKTNKATERLGSGYKINRSADNAAGMAISEKMRSQIRGLAQAGQNVQDGISLIQTAEGAMGEIQSILHRIRELSVQSANDTNILEDRENIDKEIQGLLSEIDHISEDTEFNTLKLLNGEWSDNGRGKAIPVSLDVQLNDPGLWMRTYSVDLARAQDGAVIEIDGVKFEFDLDGVSNDPAAVLIDIQGVSNMVKGTRFENAIMASPLASNYDDIQILTDPNLPLEITFFQFGTVNPHTIISHPSPGIAGQPLHIQLGPSSGESLDMYIDQMTTDALDVNHISVLTHGTSGNAISLVDIALGRVSNARSGLGSVQNRLEHAASNISNYEENLSTSESRIRDADISKEAVEYYKNNILTEAALSMQAQSVKATEGILNLLK